MPVQHCSDPGMMENDCVPEEGNKQRSAIPTALQQPIDG